MWQCYALSFRLLFHFPIVVCSIHRTEVQSLSCFVTSSLTKVTRVAQLVAAWQPGCEEMEREWGNEEEMKREWGNEEEMEREWGNGERDTLYISSFSPYFLSHYQFSIKENCHFLSRMSKKTWHTRYEKIILDRNRCEEAPQVVPAWKSLPLLPNQRKLYCGQVSWGFCVCCRQLLKIANSWSKLFKLWPAVKSCRQLVKPVKTVNRCKKNCQRQ